MSGVSELSKQSGPGASGEGPIKAATDMDLELFLNPRSIAIIGASADTGSIRGRILDYLLQREYPGKLYLVSPTQAEIRGHKTYPTLAEIPGPVDLVLMAVRADATLGLLRECAAIGVRYAICYSSGFAESGEDGARMQRELAELAANGGPRLCGPNTAGFFNVKAQIPATFARNVDARRPAIATRRSGPGTVTIVAQSGGLGFAINDRCAGEHGLIVNYVVSTGNEVDLEALDFADFAVRDADTRVVLLLVEAIKCAEKLPALAARAIAARKPIIVSKFGRTDAGSRAVGSHAARLTGSDEAYDAAFRRHGMIRVDDEDTLADLAAAFSVYAPPAGRNVGILTTSGGAGVWMADACESVGLSVPLLDDVTQQALAQYIPSYGAIHNPVDMTAQVSVNPVGGSVQLSPLVGSVKAMLESPSLHSVVLVANMSDGDVLARERDQLAELAASLQKPLFLYSHAPPSQASRELVQELGLVCFASTRRVAATILHMVEYAEACERLSGGLPDLAPAIAADDVTALAGGLCEYEAKALLKRYGLPVGDEALAKTADEAAQIAAGFAAPVALKIQSRQIQHKTEIGGVLLGLNDAAEIKAGFDTVMARAGQHAPDATVDGVLVQKMAPMGRELAVGIVHDADFGPMMMVGLGGIFIEVLKDVVIEPLPVRRDTALSMLRRLRAWPILEGTRGKPAADIEAVAMLMEKLSRMVEGAGDACREIDLNPVFVYDEGKGAIIVDSMIVGRDEVISAEAHQ
ncbi:MAG: acetate--CoA ligase family protein [Alphaproteobacteria bacterium]|nr:acetate--CoA ligase family protein [Alphaproteobacteria bacterium]